MLTPRSAQVIALAAALIAAGCSAPRPPATPERGTLQASVTAPPSDVKAMLVVVIGQAIPAPLSARMDPPTQGPWRGQVLNVPPGTGRIVTVYAYSTPDVPADPVADTTGLIYRGETSNVTVIAGQLTSVVVPLLPWPDGGGEVGVNTPPHLTSLQHGMAVASGGTAAFTAAAVDPDAGNLLTYTWSDDAGGTFTGGDAGTLWVFSNQPSGQAVPVDYAPPPGFVGVVTIRVSVSDGKASAAATFPLDVGSGVGVGLQFVVLPTIRILPVAGQSLVPGATMQFEYELSYPEGAGPDAPGAVQVEAAWKDSCGGVISDSYDLAPIVYRGAPPMHYTVTYTAPAVAPPAPGQCNLKLTLVGPAQTDTWSGLVVWVNPTVTGLWTGPATDQVRGAFTATFDITQAGDSVAGTYVTSFGGQGSFAGTTDGTTIDFVVTVLNPGCFGTLTGTATASPDASQMEMHYVGSTACMGPTEGIGTLTKQVVAPQGDRLVFVTSTTSTGALGGLDGADALCQARAQAGGLPGQYLAFLSTSTVDARDRVADARYVLRSGTEVAASRADLLDATLQHAIDMDEFGQGGRTGWVWTGSYTFGVLWPALACNDWMDATWPAAGNFGVAESAGWDWDNWGSTGCNQSAALYCFQQ